MLLGAFGGYYTALQTGSLALAIVVGMGVGALLGVITALVSVTLKAEQGISGIGVYLFALGFSDLLFLKLVGTPLPINQLASIDIPLLDRIPARRRDALQAGHPRLRRVPPRPGRRRSSSTARRSG